MLTVFAVSAHGRIDGTFHGRRYFACPKGKGLFIHAHDVVSVLAKKVRKL